MELNGQPLVVPSELKSKPKFLNWRTLLKLDKDPSAFPPVREILTKIEDALRYQEISRRLFDQWKAQSANGTAAMTFQQFAVGGVATDEIRVIAPRARFDDAAPPDQALTFLGNPLPPSSPSSRSSATSATSTTSPATSPVLGNQVRIEHWSKGRLDTTYHCDAVDVQLIIDQLSRTGVGAAFNLRGNVQRYDHIHEIPNAAIGSTPLSGIILSDAIKTVPDHEPDQLFDLAKINPSDRIKDLNIKAIKSVQDLFKKIDSEFHSRGSFSLSCLTLVLFGAALGILLRGRNPLAVFVLGFAPAVLLVLLITAGRQLAEGEGSAKSVHAGLTLIWAGNVFLLVLVMGVYAKLLRH